MSRTTRQGTYARDILTGTLANLLTAAVGFGISVAVARSFGTEPHGIFVNAVFLFQIGWTVSLLGIDQAVLQQTAEKEGTPGGIPGEGHAIGGWIALLALVGGAFLTLAAPVLERMFAPGLAHPLRIVAAAVPPAVMNRTLLAALAGQRRIGLQNLFLGIRGILLAGTAGAGFAFGSLSAVLVAFPISEWLLLLLLAAFARPEEKRTRLPRVPFPVLLRLGWPLGIAALLSTLYGGRIDTLMITRLLGKSEAGVYGIAALVLIGLSLVGASLKRASHPRLAAAYVSGPPERFRETIESTATTSLLAGGIAGTATAILFPPVLRILFAEQSEFMNGIPPLLILLGALPMLYLMDGIGVASSVVIRRPGLALATTGFSLTVGTLLYLRWIPRWGLPGGAAATVGMILTHTTMSLWIFRRLHGFLPAPATLLGVPLLLIGSLAAEWTAFPQPPVLRIPLLAAAWGTLACLLRGAWKPLMRPGS